MVARVDAEASAAPDQYWKFGLVLDPFVPAVLLVLMLAVLADNVPKPVEPAVVAVRLIVAPLCIVFTLFTGTLGVAPLPQSQLLPPELPPFVIALNRFVATVEGASPLNARMVHAAEPDGALNDELLNVYTMLPIVTFVLPAGREFTVIVPV